MTQARYFALIPAAGVGTRMGAQCPKQYLPILGVPMLRRTIDVFRGCSLIAHCFVVVSADDAYIDTLFDEQLPHSPHSSHLLMAKSNVTVLRCGGATRRETVLAGLHAIQSRLADDDWVLVHDAARPGLTPPLIAALIGAVADDPVGGLLALPVVDTVKRRSPDGVQTIARDGLWLAQTPQMFRYAMLRRALEQVEEVTDEASAIEAMGLEPKLVEGHPRNLKVTLPRDIEIVDMYLKSLT